MKLNNKDIRTIKILAKRFFLYTMIVSLASTLVFMIIAIIGYKTRAFGVPHILIAVPILTAINGIIIELVFRNVFLYFGILEQGLDDVANGNYKTRIKTEHSGVFAVMGENFNKMASELENTQILNEEFVHNFSHEFKTPIAAINGFSELLLEDDVSDEDSKKYLKIINTESNRLTNLAEKVLFLSRLNTQSIITNKKEYRLDKQIKECVILTQKYWENKKIEITANLREITYNNNPELIQEVWLNLLGNAIKYTNENGKIDLKLTKSGSKIIFTITDNGIGIEEEKLPYIFNEYYQCDESHHKKGVGLGLSIVQKIIKMSGGTIEVKSKVGKGTSFIVTL